MKVYVITMGEYDAYHICSVCLDKKLAEKRAEVYRLDRFYGESVEIEEYDTGNNIVDEYYVENEKLFRKDGRKVYEVQLSKDKTVYITEQDFTQYDNDPGAIESTINDVCPLRNGNLWVAVLAHNENEAKNIALDQMLQSTEYRLEQLKGENR